MFFAPNRQILSQAGRGVILFLAIFFCLSLSVRPVLALAAADASGEAPGQSLLTRAADWAVSAWQNLMAWIIEQSARLARAFSRGRSDNELAAVEGTIAPQILGETVLAAPPPVSPSAPLPVAPAVASPDLAAAPAAVAPAVEPAPAPAEESVAEPVETLVEPASPPAPAKEPVADQGEVSSFVLILASDFVPPVSAITALPSATATPGSATSSPFTVFWTGLDTDITGNPTILSYDIQYQANSGVWQDWLLETSLQSSSFTSAEDEKTYGFRSRARDRHNNLEEYPTLADASIYANLSVPATPVVTSHSNGQTVTSIIADENPLTSDIEVTLSGTAGAAGDVLTIALDETDTTATTTITAPGNWSKQFTLAEDLNSFSLQAQETDGDRSATSTFSLNLEMIPTHDVAINEIAWMGTLAATSDEWLELYNASSTAITLTGWTLKAASGTPDITLSGIIAAKSYFLLERTANTTVSNIAADQIYTGALTNSGDRLSLRNSLGTLIDRVGSTTAAWFAGDNSSAANRATMERKDPTADGTVASNWANNDGVYVNGQDANSTNLKGTAKSLNSVNTTIPRAVTDLQPQYIYSTQTSVRLYWTTPKTANLATTTPASYDLRYSTSNITESNFASASSFAVGFVPSATEGGVATTTVTGLTANTTYYFALETFNGNATSTISNIATVATEDGNYTQKNGCCGSTTTWTRALSPFLVTSDVNVLSGNSLTIEAGAVVKMYGNFSIILAANSSLIIGTSTDSINATVITSRDDNTYGGTYTGNIGGYATASDGSPGAGDWKWISAPASGDTVTINNGIIRYGGSGSALNDEDRMINLNNGAIADITRSIISNSNSNGIQVASSTTRLIIASSTISAIRDGVKIINSAHANIQGSTFTGNRRGIFVDTPADEANISIGSIIGNNFYSNSSFASTTPHAGIQYTDTSTLMAENNWWGSSSGPTTIDNDGDDTRDAAYTTTGTIDFTPYAGSIFTILPSNL